MKQFILELGKDFIFMDQEYPLTVGAFLRIFLVAQDVVCDRVAVAPVLFCSGGYCALIAHPVQFYDFVVLHCALLSLWVKAFHLYRQQKSFFIARTEKLFHIYHIMWKRWFPLVWEHAAFCRSTGIKPGEHQWFADRISLEPAFTGAKSSELVIWQALQ